MDEIKQVFEGSCDLIPIKTIAKECKKLADDFTVELVDTLASEMNPQVINLIYFLLIFLIIKFSIRLFARQLASAIMPQLISYSKNMKPKNHHSSLIAQSATTLAV